MPDVKAPNGDVYDLPEAVASGLVGSEDAGWSYPKGKSAQGETSSSKSAPSTAAPSNKK